MTTATPRRSLPSSSQAGKDKDFFLISQARNAHPCITPSPKPTPSIVKSFSLYNRRPSAFQHRQDKKRRFYRPRSISDGTPVRSAEKARASTSSSSGLTAATLPRTHDTSTSRDTQSLDYASLHDNPAAVTVNNRNSAPTTQPAINLPTSSKLTSTTPTTMPPTPTVTPGTLSPSLTLPSIQRTPSRFFVHHPLSTRLDNTTTMPPTSSSPPSSPPKPPTTSNNSLSTVLHHSPGNISRRNAVHGRGGGGGGGGGGGALPAFATVSSAMLVPEPLRVNVAHRVRRQGIATAPLSPPISPPPRLRPQMQLQQQASSTVTGTTGSSTALTASTQATTASSSWSSSSAAVSSNSGEAGVEKNLQASATPRRLLFPPSLTRRAKREGLRGGGGGGGGTYPFSSSSFLGASSSSASSLRDGKGGKVLENGGDGPVVRRKPVSANAMTACSPVRERKMVGEEKKKKKKSLVSRKLGEGSARSESSNSDDSYPEELEKLEREILSLLFPNPGQRYSSSSMSSSSERKLHELGGGGGGGAASLVTSSGCSDGYMPSNGTTTHRDSPNAPNNLRGLRPSGGGGPFPTAPPPPLLDPRDEEQMYALMFEEEEQSEPDGAATIPTSDSYARLNQSGWQSKLARKKSGGDDENQTLRQIIRQQRHHQQLPSPPTPPSPQLLPLPSPMPSPSPPLLPPRYRRNTVTRQSSGPPPTMRLSDPPVSRLPLQRLQRSRL